MNTSTHGSTGPRTPEGKAISAKNALKHGFTSRDLVIPDHLRGDFEQLQSRLLAEVVIHNELQNQAFRQYLRASWNLFRLDIEEARLFNEKGIDALLAPEHAHLQRYRRQQERSRNEAIAEMRRIVKELQAASDHESEQQKHQDFRQRLARLKLKQQELKRQGVRLEEQSANPGETPATPPQSQAA